MEKKRFKKIYIEITNICNLKCEFCIDNNRKKEYMSIQNFEKIIEKISPYTDYIYLHVKGEPLMHPQLNDILNIAYKYDLKTNITTNGTLLNTQFDILKNSKSLRQLNISLHSIEQNVKLNINKFEYIDTVIKCANEINRNNGAYISYRIWDMDDESKDKSYIISALQDVYNMDDIDIRLKQEGSIKLCDGIYINADNAFDWPSMQHNIVSYNGSCYGLKEQIAILVDGTVVPCCLDQQGDIPLGNIFQSELDSIIDSKVAKEMIKGFNCNKLVQPLCQRCDFRVKKRK